MLDGETYRLSERLARRRLSTWQVAEIQVVAFEHSHFPRDIKSLSEVGQLLNTMQENRYESYVEELEGLSTRELRMFVDAIADLVVFQWTHMPDVPVQLPYSTAVSALVNFIKLRALCPSFETILEIGSGCGYLPLFLKDHRPLKTYSSTEACEAYYLLQSAINAFTFPGRAEERAYPSLAPGTANYFTVETALVEAFENFEFRVAPKCIHVPWWRIGDLRETKYDLVASNANLREFKPQALRDYLALIGETLKEDGFLVAQCLGGHLHTRGEDLRNVLYDAGFAPLVYLEQGGDKSVLNPTTGTQVMRRFPIGQGVFIRKGHPLFARYYHRQNYDSDFLAREECITRAFFPEPGPRFYFRQVEITEMVRNRLEERFA